MRATTSHLLLLCALASLPSAALAWSSSASRTYNDIRQIHLGILMYLDDTGACPDSGRWWQQLRGAGCAPGLGEATPCDRWGGVLRYRAPGDHGAFDLYSVGPNGRDDRGTLDDVSNWAAVNEGFHWQQTWPRGRASIGLGVLLASGVCLLRLRLPWRVVLPLASLALGTGVALGCRWLMHPGVYPQRNTSLAVVGWCATAGAICAIAWLAALALRAVRTRTRRGSPRPGR
jgi:hypothetical protein